MNINTDYKDRDNRRIIKRRRRCIMMATLTPEGQLEQTLRSVKKDLPPMMKKQAS